MVAAAVVATITLGVSACSGRTGAGVAASVPATTQVQPTSRPAPSSTSGAAVAVTPLARSTPVRLLIPAIGVNSRLMRLGLQADGSVEVPPNAFPAGWYTKAPTPGELGPAIILGHVHWNGPGVFYDLQKVKPGDQIVVTRADGSKPAFRITRIAAFRKVQFPTKLVYGDIDHAGLRLITCGGFDSRARQYEDNIVVFADLIAPTP
jgi:Sortase domain